ncbi:MAG: hypothetical protein U5K79_11375 [Cyclobacteriaceae bacterium]|nr:hypothetical protein [Cyclobacteriaceae bacterium]
MKTTNSHIEEEVRKTMTSLDGLTSASPRPFFYTRLKARMESSEPSTEKVFAWKPAYQRVTIGVVVILLVFNIFTATLILGSGSQVSTETNTEQTFFDQYYPSLTTIDNLEQSLNQ